MQSVLIISCVICTLSLLRGALYAHTQVIHLVIAPRPAALGEAAEPEQEHAAEAASEAAEGDDWHVFSR